MPIEFSNQLIDHISDKDTRTAIRKTLQVLSTAAIEISDICARGLLEQGQGAATGARDEDGDVQKALDVRTDEIILAALKTAPVSFYASEEQDDVIALKKGAPLAVACDPLDGSTNIDTNLSIGTIFSFYPSGETAKESFFRCGSDQVAGGFFVYGPQTTLIVTTGNGTELYTLDRESRTFKLSIDRMSIPEESTEFGINASNRMHWPAPIGRYIEHCQMGEDGPFGIKHGMRWAGSLVADTNRILMRGGIYLYPDDDRKGYGEGRLRLLYEANPVSFLIEQAGGSSTDGTSRILGKTLRTLHQRVPFIFGSAKQVGMVAKYYHKKSADSESPLFKERGLLR